MDKTVKNIVSMIQKNPDKEITVLEVMKKNKISRQKARPLLQTVANVYEILTGKNVNVKTYIYRKKKSQQKKSTKSTVEMAKS